MPDLPLLVSGGIGEHDGATREAICHHLAFLQPFEVLVGSAEEERVIAGHCLKLLPGA